MVDLYVKYLISLNNEELICMCCNEFKKIIINIITCKFHMFSKYYLQGSNKILEIFSFKGVAYELIVKYFFSVAKLNVRFFLSLMIISCKVQVVSCTCTLCSL
ncbi:hypothetical protein HanPSC8_Chr17g0792481 [Helianthus annuus]|nr:hypothetical protein HanPSC8_Chr17g0792481 [Helianthus annuus]